MNIFTVRVYARIRLSVAWQERVLRWINVQHTGDESVTEFRDGRQIDKYPQATTVLAQAHCALFRADRVGLDVSYDKDGKLVDVQWVKPAGPKTLMQVFSEEAPVNMNTFIVHARAKGSSKLSDADQIVTLMRDGYELGQATSVRGKVSWWLQKPKLGQGSSIVFVHTHTARSMQRKGQIKLAVVNTPWQSRFELA